MTIRRERIAAIEYMRGIAMLGVVGIHIGSQYIIANPTPNLAVVALYEIVTRFAVPIFFFISAFGLFYNLDLTKPFNYRQFMIRRGKTVLIPYVIWSLLYVIEYAVYYHSWGWLNPINFLFMLIFGLASYQLYFMVLLLWFYILMPLWIMMVKRLNIAWLVILFILQVAFDYYSSYGLNPYAIQNWWLKNLVTYRLNYLVLHYLFIFLLGGYLAVHYATFKLWMQEYLKNLRFFMIVSLAGLLGYYYYCIYHLGYSAESAVNTAHQLSPPGLIYTLAACLYLFAECQYGLLSRYITGLQHLLGYHSYFIYLGHPFAITLVKALYGKLQLVMTALHSFIFYLLVMAITLLMAIAVRRLSERYCPLINELTIGVYRRKKNKS